MSEKLFSQSDVDRIVKERVAREKRSFERELEEVRSVADTGEPGYKSKYLDAMKRKSLLDAGIPYDKVDGYMKYVKGEEPDEIKRQVAEFASILDAGKREEKKQSGWDPFSK